MNCQNILSGSKIIEVIYNIDLIFRRTVFQKLHATNNPRNKPPNITRELHKKGKMQNFLANSSKTHKK